MAKKIFYVMSSHHGNKTIYEGTIEYLSGNVFGYTLECGHSWDRSINRNPRTVKGLVSALNRSANECRRYYDHYSVSNKEEFDAAEGFGKSPMMGV